MTKHYRSDSPALKNNHFKIGGINLIKSLILYGRNASGKSNILKAFRALTYLINNSDKLKHQEVLQPYEPYLFEKSNAALPVELEICFFAKDNIKYCYSIKFNKTRFLYESLYFWPNGVESKLFIRDLNNFTFGEYYKGDKASIQKELLENQLYLSKSATKNIKYLKNVYLFLSKYLFISTIQDDIFDDFLISSACDNMQKDNFIKENMKILLSAADTNIIDFNILKKDYKLPENVSDEYKKLFIKRYENEIKTSHNLFHNGKKIGLTDLPFRFESLGTKKLIAVGVLILDALLDGSVLIIDELDKSLHPLLTRMLISLFHSKKNNPNNAQLIFATHDSSLLDNNLFDREQIGFVDKEYEGNTILFKLRDIKGARKDIP
ncbi:MAG TPA: ATP-binding protein, partial [Ignavibacteria bacterium]|nr:ATP-binding protein [Ignavibacteria bacterium]